MNLLDQLKRDLDPKAGLSLSVEKDLSFTPVKNPYSLADTYRKQFKTIATSVYLNMNSMLSLLTVDQLELLVQDADCQAHPFTHPEDESNDTTLEGIYLEGTAWWFVLHYSNDGLQAGTYTLVDMNVQDILFLMDKIEALLHLKR